MRERRQFVRLDARLLVRYWVLTSKQPVVAATKDLSGGGVRLALDAAVAPHTPLAIELSLPEQPEPVRFVGDVVWCEPAQGEDPAAPARFEAGVSILKIDPKDQQQLVQLIAQGKKPSSPA